MRDLRGAETAQRLQGQDQLALARHGLVAADEQHAQQVVLHLGGEKGRQGGGGRCRRGGGLPRCDLARVLRQDAGALGLAPELPDQVVVRHPVQPGAGIVGKPLRRPFRQGRHQCGLHRVLGHLQLAHPHQAGEHRHQAPVLVTEEMFDQARHGGPGWRFRGVGQEPTISRISI
jgi:hypothetical protein